MRIITQEAEYRKLSEILSKAINIGVRPPYQVFKTTRNFLFLDFSAFCTQKFFEAYREVSKGESFFYSINPDPKTYYYHYFKKYNVFLFNNNSTFIEYKNVLHEKPEPNSADAIIDVVDELVICSKELGLAVYGNRAQNLLIVGFENEKLKMNFLSKYGKQSVFSIEEVVSELLPNSYESGVVPKKDVEVLKFNYSQ